MSRQAKTLPPRWRAPAPAGPVFTVSKRRHARMMAREFAKATGKAEAGTLAATSTYRWRRQLVPFWLLTGIAAAGESLHLAGEARMAFAALVPAGAMWLLTRHHKPFGKRAGIACACLTALWVPLIAAFGVNGPAGAVLLVTWVPLAAAWARHYRIRPGERPEANTDYETWERLAEHKRWAGKLGAPEKIPGGRRYPLVLDGVKTHIGDVLGQPLSIAAAWHKPVTEAYAEKSPDGIASRGSLTVLSRGTLQQGREWDGTGVTEDGFAEIGRFADGAPMRLRLYAPMDGTRHSLLCGTTGAGKSSLLDLLLRIMLSSGWFYPVVLDPQEGQSLPDWNGHVPYAAGVDECMEMLKLLREGMLARSRRLASMTWDDDGHTRKMSFFDRNLTGWPVVSILADEAHMLLTGDGRTEVKRASEAVDIVKDIGKLGRKTGVRMDLVTQVPSLEELASNVLRSMLRGGNVLGLRTADAVSGGMLGLPADPADIPQYFPDGSFTYGLCYAHGPDRRDAIGRTDTPSAAQRRLTYPLPVLEDSFAEILARFGTALPLPTPAAPGTAPVLTAVPPDDSPAPGGQTAADAIMAVLDREMSRGEILAACRDKAAEWGRDRPWTMRAVTGPLKTMTEEGTVVRVREGVYAPPRPSLTVVGGSAPASVAGRSL